jgi:hypothetical protein
VEVAANNPRSRQVLVLFTGSMGEVDWLLPVLQRLRQRSPETKILASIGDPHLQAELRRSDFFRTRLEAVAEVFHGGQDRLGARCQPRDIGLILKTDDPDDGTARALRRRLPHVPVVTFPSGTAILTLTDDPDPRVDDYFTALARHTGQDPRQDYGPADLCLATSPHLVPYYRNVMPGSEIRVVGSPRYDRWWVKELLDDPTLAGSPEASLAHHFATTVLLIARGPHWLYLDENDHHELLAGFAATISRWPNVGALIKPHPRQDPKQLTSWLREQGAEHTLISHRPLLQLAHLADLTVSMFSSGVLDSLRVGTPTVEYYRYHSRQPVLEFRRAADGRLISIYEKLGLVENVATVEGLAHTLERAHAGDHADDADLSQRMERARAVARWADDRAGSVAEVLLGVMARVQARESGDRRASRQMTEVPVPVPRQEDAIHA